jgi:rRNA maturation protein Nop10
VTTREACTVCGSLAGVFPPCDCFSNNPRDQKGEECVSLSVFYRVVVLVTTPDACTVCGSLTGVFPARLFWLQPM